MAMISSEFNHSLFSISNPNEMFLTTAIEKQIKKIGEGIREGKKLFLVTGDRDCGKKTLVQRAISDLGTKAKLIDVNGEILNSKETIDYEGLVGQISNSMEGSFKSNTAFEEKLVIQKKILQKKLINHIVFVIDQPLNFHQNLLVKALHQLDSKLGDSCSFHLIITASHEYSKKLLESGLLVSSLNDSCLLQIEPLTESEVISYIEFHLKQLKKQEETVFSEDSLKRIVHYSKGRPGLINRLCSLGLLTANIEEKSVVSLEMIDEVLENSLFLGNEFNYSTSSPESEEPEPIELPLENQEVLVESTDIIYRESTGLLEPVGQAIKIQKDLDEKTLVGSSTHHPANSSKSAFLRAFIMGMLVTGITGAGLYIFQQSIQDNSVKHVVTAESSEVQQKNILTQQLIEARLNRLEQQINEQQGVKSVENDLDNSKQKLLLQNLDSKKAETIATKNISGTTKLKRNQKNVKGDTSALAADTTKTQLIHNTQEEDAEFKIQELLALGEQQLVNKKLIVPLDDNAWATYKETLSISPGHPQAIAGIKKIKETYLRWARYEIKKGNKGHALLLFRKALKVSPDDPDILTVLNKIQHTKLTGASTPPVPLKGKYRALLDKKGGMKKLLGMANQQIIDKNLTTPTETSAFAIYHAILDRYPKHEKAWEGIDRIKKTYIRWARYEMRQGDLSHAQYLYRKALELAPSDPEILYALGQFKKVPSEKYLKKYFRPKKN